MQRGDSRPGNRSSTSSGMRPKRTGVLRGDFQQAEQWRKSDCARGLLGATPLRVLRVQMFMIRRETGELRRFSGFVDGSEAFTGRWVPGLLALYTELDCEAGMAAPWPTCSAVICRSAPDTRSGRWNWSSWSKRHLVGRPRRRRRPAALRRPLRGQEHHVRPVRRDLRQRRPISRQDRGVSRRRSLRGAAFRCGTGDGSADGISGACGGDPLPAEPSSRRVAVAPSRRGDWPRRRVIATPIGQARVLSLVGALLNSGGRAHRAGDRGTPATGLRAEQPGNRRTALHQHQHGGESRPQHPTQRPERPTGHRRRCTPPTTKCFPALRSRRSCRSATAGR